MTKERLETSIGGFEVEWGVRLGPGDEPDETELTLAPVFDQADSPPRTRVSSTEGIESVLVRADVPIDEARSLSSDLWEQRRRAEEDRRRRDEQMREYHRGTPSKRSGAKRLRSRGFGLYGNGLPSLRSLRSVTRTRGSTTRMS